MFTPGVSGGVPLVSNPSAGVASVVRPGGTRSDVTTLATIPAVARVEMSRVVVGVYRATLGAPPVRNTPVSRAPTPAHVTARVTVVTTAAVRRAVQSVVAAAIGIGVGVGVGVVSHQALEKVDILEFNNCFWNSIFVVCVHLYIYMSVV